MSDYNITLYQYKKSAKSYRKSFVYHLEKPCFALGVGLLSYILLLSILLHSFVMPPRCLLDGLEMILLCFVISFLSFPFGEVGRGCYKNCYKGLRITSNAMNISKLHVFKGSHKLHVNHSLIGVTC